MLIQRGLESLLKKSTKSILLLGPRQTGKSTIIKTLNPDLSINLAHEQVYLDFASHPSELDNRLKAKNFKVVFIDEVQRLPSILNTIQAIIDDSHGKIKFYLTGSSARKLKRGNANLLPGRIHSYYLTPLSAQDLGYEVNTKRALEIGTLPGIYISENLDDAQKTLRTYAATYLKEEIQAEALTRNVEGFSRFLFVAAACAGAFLDFSKLAIQAQITRQSAARYFEILEETLLVYRCDCFSNSLRSRLIKHPKYYFFDTGVLNALLGNFKASNDRKGNLFEHLFMSQIAACAHGQDLDFKVSTYKTEHGAEVDFILEVNHEIWAIELKASNSIGKNDLRGLKNFNEYHKTKHHSAVAYMGSEEKKIDGIPILPWQNLLKIIFC